MGSSIKITQDLKPLEQLNKNAKEKFVTKVGILGRKNSRNDKNTNALIGAVHEFGSASNNIPRRSFLNDPLIIKSKELKQTISEKTAENLLKKNGMRLTFQQVGAKAEEIIQRAFQSGGFGKWQPLKPKTIKRKGSSSILISSGELRKSISSSVEKL